MIDPRIKDSVSLSHLRDYTPDQVMKSSRCNPGMSHAFSPWEPRGALIITRCANCRAVATSTNVNHPEGAADIERHFAIIRKELGIE